MKKTKKRMMSLLLILTFIVLLQCWGAVPVVSAESGYTGLLKDAPIGTIIKDTANWEHKTFPDYSGPGETKAVEWIVVAKNHYETYPDVDSVTLLAKELIAQYRYDYGGNNVWTISSTRKWLSNVFYNHFSPHFKEAILYTDVINKRYDGHEYTIKDRIFIPSRTELGGGNTDTYTIGARWLYFQVYPNSADRIAQLGGDSIEYSTRSPERGESDLIHIVLNKGSFYSEVCGGSFGVRPVLNLKTDINVINGTLQFPQNVTYDGNGNTEGSAPIDTSTYLPEKSVQVMGNIGSLKRTGYTFTGWNTQEDGQGTTYQPDDTFTMKTSDVTLYAKWTANYTGLLREAPLGTIVKDRTNWEHKTGVGYTGSGENKPVEWIVAAKNHSGYPEDSVTLISKELIGKYDFEDSNLNHWGNSSIRSWLNNTFYNNLSSGFKGVVLDTIVSNKVWDSGAAYNTTDKLFIPSQTELGGDTTDTHAIGTNWGYFNTEASRITQLDSVNLHYWTRSPCSYSSERVNYVEEGGKFGRTEAEIPDIGIRPALNISSDLYVNADGTLIYNHYTVTYNGNGNTGGSVPTDSNSYFTGHEVTVSGNTGNLVRTGYTFLGWNTQANGQGKNYQANDNFNMGTSDVTLYAKWKANYTGPLSQAPLGTIIKDTALWEHRTGPINWTPWGEGYTGSGDTKSVEWIVVAHNHPGYPTNSVTLMSKELIAKYEFDTSTDRGSYSGSNHWGNSGTPNATSGLRPWLNDFFYSHFSSEFKDAVLETTVPNKVWNTGAGYTTTDKIFIPSQTELGGNTTETYAIGTNWGYFKNADSRMARLGGAYDLYWTRSPASISDGMPRYVWVDGSFTEYDNFNKMMACTALGVRPVLNLTSRLYVNADGTLVYPNTVTYNGNGNTGGNVPTDAKTYLPGNSVGVIGNTGNLVRTGYTFVGWNTKANGQGTSYQVNDTFNMGTSNVTLYANWREVVIASITPVANVEVAYGTSEAAAIAGLAATTTIEDSDSQTHTVNLSWTIANYDGNSAGNYTATGTFNLPTGVAQSTPPTELKVTAIVTVGATNSATISPESATFDLNNPADVNATITWNEATSVTDVKKTGVSVGAAGYSVNGNTLTINKEYLSTQTTGSQVLTIEFNIGDSATLTIDIIDTTVITKPVTSINVKGMGDATTVVKGTTLQMIAEVEPADATDKTVTWSVIPETGTATIDADGLLTGTGAGTAKVRATANDGSGIYGETTITVEEVSAADPTISPQSATFDLNNPADLSTNITWNDAQSVTDMVYGSVPMTVGIDYTVVGNTLTIKGKYLSDLNLAEGSSTEFIISFDVGDDAVLTANIVNNYVPGNDASLRDLSINGVTVTGFVHNNYNYNVQLPYNAQPGSDAATVAVTVNDPNARVNITQAAILPGSATVVVTAEDGVTQQTYTINFSLGAAPNISPNRKAGISATDTASVRVNTAYILDLSTIFEDADGDTLTYEVAINGAAVVSANESYAYIPSVAGITKFVFTANDGIHDSNDTYTVTLTTTIEQPDISPTSVNYSLDAPADVSTTISWGSGQTVTGVVYNSSLLALGMDYTITVDTLIITKEYLASFNFSAGDTAVFDISFDIGTPVSMTVNAVENFVANNDATLRDLTVNGSTVTGFASNNYNYTVELPYGTQPGSGAATVWGILNDLNASVNITQASILPGSATVVVTAEDGVTQQTYTINFTLGAAPNTPPTARIPVSTQTVREGGMISFVAYDIAEDADGNTMAITDIRTAPTITIATADLNNETVTITGVNAGSTSMTVRVSDGEDIVDVTVPITVTESQTPVYTLTIAAGSGGRITTGSSGNYTAGTVINIVARASSNYSFNKWTSSGGGTFGNANSADTIFTMPVNAVTITADFSYNGGDGSDSSTHSAPAIPTPKADVTVTDIAGSDILETTLPVTVAQNAGNVVLDVDSQQDNIITGGRTAVITVPYISGVTDYTLGIPVAYLSTPDGGGTLTFNTDTGNVTLPADMLVGITEAEGKKVEITIGQGDKSSLREDIQTAIGDRPLIQMAVSVDGEQIEWNNPDAPVTISIPYTPTAEELSDSEHITVWYIDGSGNVVEVPSGRYDPQAGMVTFSTTHFSDYAVVFVQKTFKDLDNVVWAKKPIEVLASKGILKGVSENEYAPGANITRADFLYFLVRTLGVDAKVDENFDDIRNDAYYYKEIGIAKKLGITSGTGNNKFSPDASITRQDMMALTERALRMLNKLGAQGTASDLDKFADKSLVAAYAVNGVAAVVKEGLIVGNGDKVNPLGNTTRAEVAVLLYRIYSKY